MKNAFLSLLFIALFFVGCGSKNSSGSAANDTSTTAPVTPVGEDFAITASRTYNPSSWSNGSYTASFPAFYRVPLQIQVISGNSGTGWSSLVVGDRKFCYQGNASNNHTPNGNLFMLKNERTSVSTDCSSGSNIIVFDQNISLQSGTQISLSVNGGGCSNSAGACLNTQVSAVIEFISF